MIDTLFIYLFCCGTASCPVATLTCVNFILLLSCWLVISSCCDFPVKWCGSRWCTLTACGVKELEEPKHSRFFFHFGVRNRNYKTPTLFHFWSCVKGGVNMDHRGHHLPDSGHHRTKDREDYYRYSQPDWEQSYPPPNPRERDRHWVHPDPRYRAHFTSPPARPDPYTTQQYPYVHGHPEHQRPQSRCVRSWDGSWFIL